MQICERLKEARKIAGMTQEEVAEKVLVSRVTISNWENGKTLPDIASLISLSELYNISLDELTNTFYLDSWSNAAPTSISFGNEENIKTFF